MLLTTDGNIRDFKMVVPLEIGDPCTIELKEIVIEADDTFAVTIQVGKTVDGQRISGKFDSATTLTGDFVISRCENIPSAH